MAGKLIWQAKQDREFTVSIHKQNRTRSLFDLTGKVAIITGGFGALEGSIAEYLVGNGVKVAILSRTADTIRAAADHSKQISPDVVAYSCSVLDQGGLELVVEDILSKWGKIDILVNAAGGNTPGATIATRSGIF